MTDTPIRMPGPGLAALWASPLARAAVFGLSYFAGAELGNALTFTTPDQVFATLWPPAGILLAALLLTRPRAWPMLLAAGCVANVASDVLVHGRPLLVGLGFCLANFVEACLGAWLVRRFVGGTVKLTRVEHVFRFTLWAALFSTLVGALLGAGVASLAYEVPYSSAWQTWWVADSLGVLVFAPVVLTWSAERLAMPSFRSVRTLECLVLFLGLLLVIEAVYGDWLPANLRIPIFVLPFLVWGGLRFGPRGATVTVLIVALVGVANTSRGRGPYAAVTNDQKARLMRAQITLFVVDLTVVVLAAIVAERRRAEAQRTRLIANLGQALKEIRTLQGLIPICAWCRKLRDEKGLWRGLEDYLRVHTEATPTHGICPECVKEQSLAVTNRK